MRNRYVLLADLATIAIAAFGAFVLRFDWLFLSYRPEFRPFLIAALLIKPTVFFGLGMYRRYWRYASVNDLLALVLAVTAASLAMTTYVVIAFSYQYLQWFSRSVLLIDGLLTLLLTGAIRLSVRIIGESRSRSRDGSRVASRRVLIAGAGDAGTIVLREMQRNPHLGMRPMGFLDDDPAKRRKRIHGVPVLGAIAALRDVIRLYRVDEVVVAMPTAQGSLVRALAETCAEEGVTSRIVPGMYELVGGRVSVNRLRSIEIADLLRRNQVVAEASVSRYLSKRVVLITGGGGSIGFELCRQVADARPAQLVLLGHGENSVFEAQGLLRDSFPDVRLSTVIADIRDRDRLQRIFQQFSPSVVFHAAAHKHVPLMEDNPEEAITNNVVGTQQVVEAAIACGTERLVLISSDKAVAPSSIMGASKRVAEQIVRDGAARSGRAFSVVRFGNVLGSRGSVITLFKRQIERGGPITVTDPEMKRFFMTIPEAVHLVLQAGGLATGGELFVLNMGQAVRIVDLVQDLIRLSGLAPDEIPIKFTGIRAGEKLEELLVDVGEATHPTTHPDILRVVEKETRTAVERARAIEALCAAAKRGDRAAIDVALAECVPTFAPAWLREGLPS